MTDTWPAAISDRESRSLATEPSGIPIDVSCCWLLRSTALHLIRNQPASQAALTWLSDNAHLSIHSLRIMQRQVARYNGDSELAPLECMVSCYLAIASRACTSACYRELDIQPMPVLGLQCQASRQVPCGLGTGPRMMPRRSEASPKDTIEARLDKMMSAAMI